MNNQNPFVPQGSLLEQDKRRSRMKLAVFCVLAVSVCGLTAMLIQGCKRETENADNNPPADTNAVATADTNAPPTEESNTTATAIVPPVPTNQPVVVPPVEPATTEYAVVAHDTLGKIAKKSGVTLKALEDANPGVVPTKLKIGQKLSIPAATVETSAAAAATATLTDTGEETYKVKSGDTLTKIAKANGTTVKAIESENNLTTTKIKVGQKLKIPAAAATAAPAPAPAAPVSPAPVAPVTPPSTTSAQ
jgi:LysM repeat protein